MAQCVINGPPLSSYCGRSPIIGAVGESAEMDGGTPVAGGIPRRSFVSAGSGSGSAGTAAPLAAAPAVPPAFTEGDEPDLAAAISAARCGDEAAFRLIYRTTQPGLLRYLRVLVGTDAEDVASEAWLQIARDLASFRGGFDDFRGWAATIARHRALDHLRRRSRRRGDDVPVEMVMTALAAPDDTARSALEVLSTEAAMRLIASLPLDQAEAVLLRVVMGLDAKAAGRVLGKRAGAVRTASHRGLRRLAEQLGEPGIDGPGGL